ncbi:hypothetical protein SLS60_001010 [Paraconiothyrium brasiliense]|uniref:Uncharacterized protein n=1 Tax=Paraconiothyrium brasiliense TaxID=300254 RepID=A0ABR3S7V0_9PLEO
MADDAAEKRLLGLTKLFNAIIHKRRELKSPGDGIRFLEALCAQRDASKCVESIVAAPGGLAAVAKAFRLSRDSAFLDGPATSVLQYLRDPEIKQLHEGLFLRLILEQIVQPPTFWNTLVESHHAQVLTDDGTLAFAWLLLEILCARSDEFPDVRDVAEHVTKNESFIGSKNLHIRIFGYRIKDVLDTTSVDDLEEGPGGRHDNDYADFRNIKILPTSDEFLSTDTPFYRPADAVSVKESSQRGVIHLDNQFRLLREDMLGELRNDVQIAFGKKKGRRKVHLKHLQFVGVDCGTVQRRKTCSVKFLCSRDIPQLQNLKDHEGRKRHIKDNKKFLKHQSLGCLVNDGSIIAFASVDRDEDRLSQIPPVIQLRIADADSLRKFLVSCKASPEFEFVQVDTAIFAYEPILRCLQNMPEVPLKEQLLDLSPGSAETLSGIQPVSIINEIRGRWQEDLKDVVGTTRHIELDNAQAHSLITGLSKRVSLIQGPPGTGKSFIGALIAKILHDETNETILVLTYTNHALDQFLEDLEDIGIPQESMVRLGRGFSASVEHLSISNVSKQDEAYIPSYATRSVKQEQSFKSEQYHSALEKRVQEFLTGITRKALLDYLELSEDYSEFFDAFQIPKDDHGLITVGKDNKQISDHKQLRPKVNNFSLTIEKGDGYDLNVSLFERLVVAGVPHTTLNRQHRMRPGISTLVRSLTYPELEDAPRTAGRPRLRGFQDNVVFVSHNIPELNAASIADRRDEGAHTSKENEYEVDMVLKCVRYLGQQGYGTDQIVILTPYLGQLYRLLGRLSEENDPILNDLDSFELIRAGLLTPAGANITKRKLRISTIDNYQGEESDIVIASLTRSNSLGDIGFMKSPQRVNVLLSRARDGLIMIGNAETFMSSHRGKEVWVPLMELLTRAGHVYAGFPVQCEKHPDRKALLTTHDAFDDACPDVVLCSAADYTNALNVVISYRITQRWRVELSSKPHAPNNIPQPMNAKTKGQRLVRNAKLNPEPKSENASETTNWIKIARQGSAPMPRNSLRLMTK